MENNNFEQLIVELSDLIYEELVAFLIANKKNIKDDDELINIVISSHISSLFNTLKLFSEKKEDIRLNINNFIMNITEAIAKSKAITKMEIIRDGEINGH